MSKKTPHNQNQHFIPQFLQRMWGDNGPTKSKEVFMVRQEQFPKDPQPQTTVKKVSIAKNFSSNGLWSAARATNKKYFEEKTATIDAKASMVWAKIGEQQTLQNLTPGKMDHIFLFINSLMARQPEVLRQNRELTEKALSEIENDPRVKSILQNQSQPVCAREIAHLGGIHIADHALLQWEKIFNDTEVMKDFRVSTTELIQIENDIIPLSDNPIWRVHDTSIRLTFCPVSPQQMLVIYRFLQPHKMFKTGYVSQLVSDYVSWAWRNCKRSVVIKHPYPDSTISALFSPKEIFGVHYGPGTDTPADQYSYGAPFAKSLRLPSEASPPIPLRKKNPRS